MMQRALVAESPAERPTPVSCARALVILLAAALLSAGCSGQQPQAVALSELAAQQEAYSGAVVEAEGTVRAFGDGADRHYVIEDNAANRVALIPEAVVERHVGRRVVVVGRFTFDEETGRTIDVDEIAEVEG